MKFKQLTLCAALSLTGLTAMAQAQTVEVRDAWVRTTVQGQKGTGAFMKLTAPNGVGLSPDEKTVYVAETHTSRVWAFDVSGPGEIRQPPDLWTPGRVLGPLPGYQLLDSLAVEAGGKVCAATIVNGWRRIGGCRWRSVRCLGHGVFV